jgi:hypothetical protein
VASLGKPGHQLKVCNVKAKLPMLQISLPVSTLFYTLKISTVKTPYNIVLYGPKKYQDFIAIQNVGVPYIEVF